MSEDVAEVSVKNKRALESDDDGDAGLSRKKFKVSGCSQNKEIAETESEESRHSHSEDDVNCPPDDATDIESKAFSNFKSCYCVKCGKLLNETNEVSDELDIKVDILTSKLSVAESKLRKAEQVNKSSNATLTSKIEAKDRLITNLQLFIDEQESRFGKLLDNRSGDDDISKGLHNFVSDIKSLQSEKANLMLRTSQLELANDEMKVNVTKLEDMLKNDYISLEKYKFLQIELEASRESEATLKKKQENKENMSSRNHLHEQRVSEVNSRLVNEVRVEMRAKAQEHYDAVSKLHSENHSLRRKLLAVENKYTMLAFTPPKVQVKEVVDMETAEELNELKLETLELQCELRQKKRELIETNKNSVVLTSQNEELKLKLKQSTEEIVNLKGQVRELDKQLKENKLDFDNLLMKKNCELSILQESIDLREGSMKQKLQAQIDKLSAKSKSKEKISLHLREFLSSLKEFKSFKTETENQISEVKTYFDDFSRSFKHDLLSMVADTHKDSYLLAQKYAKEIQLRKKLHNQLVELKGNIRVFCRVRPLIREDGEHASNVITFHNMDDSLVYVEHKSSKKKFEVDKVFPPHMTQSEIFEEVKSLIKSCLDGYNICIFAYGQTGSGKTYTMEGTETNPGINQQALQLLFHNSAELSDWDFQIFVSFIEIYNETLYDLLSEESQKLDIKQRGKDGVHVPGLTQIKVSKLADVNEIFSLGRKNRSVAATSMNERSSRSHSVLTITVLGNNRLTGTRVEGKLNLVDLAGSERVSKSGSEGIHLKEAQCINKSLSALGDVIHALKNKNQHIPYRNTKLTYLLQNCLSKDSKTLMMVQLSPADKNSAETFCSLDFAQRVRSVELGKSTRSLKNN